MTCFRVSLGPHALETIEEEIFNTSCDHPDGLVETGGWLWSRQDENWWIGGLRVVEASGPGPGAVRAYDSVILPTDYVLDLDLMLRDEGLSLCGRWHLHPGHDDTPSGVDVESIAKVIEYRSIWGSKTPRALELIFTQQPNPNGRGVRPWAATPWIFRYGKGGITGTVGAWPEPAILENRRGLK